MTFYDREANSMRSKRRSSHRATTSTSSTGDEVSDSWSLLGLNEMDVIL
jgi:hypothetical protein